MTKNWAGFTFYENGTIKPEWEGDEIYVVSPLIGQADNWMVENISQTKDLPLGRLPAGRFFAEYQEDHLWHMWSEGLRSAKEIKQHDAWVALCQADSWQREERLWQSKMPNIQWMYQRLSELNFAWNASEQVWKMQVVS